MRNGTRTILLTACFAAVAFLFTGCGGCIREAAKAAADEVRQEARERANKLQEQLNEAAQQNQQLQKTITSAQTEIERLKSDQNHRAETEQRLWGYARLFFYIIGIVTCLKLFGRPLYRVAAAVVLRVLPLQPRQIIQGNPNETRMEQT